MKKAAGRDGLSARERASAVPTGPTPRRCGAAGLTVNIAHVYDRVVA